MTRSAQLFGHCSCGRVDVRLPIDSTSGSSREPSDALTLHKFVVRPHSVATVSTMRSPRAARYYTFEELKAPRSVPAGGGLTRWTISVAASPEVGHCSSIRPFCTFDLSWNRCGMLRRDEGLSAIALVTCDMSVLRGPGVCFQGRTDFCCAWLNCTVRPSMVKR